MQPSFQQAGAGANDAGNKGGSARVSRQGLHLERMTCTRPAGAGKDAKGSGPNRRRLATARHGMKRLPPSASLHHSAQPLPSWRATIESPCSTAVLISRLRRRDRHQSGLHWADSRCFLSTYTGFVCRQTPPPLLACLLLAGNSTVAASSTLPTCVSCSRNWATRSNDSPPS